MSSLAAVRRLTDLFLLLSEDEALLAEYQRDPGRILGACRLEPAAAALIVDGDLRRVRSTVAEENRPRRWRYEPAPP